MGFTLETGISALAVFVQGLLSFFSPCVLPLVPLYLSYLSAGAYEASLGRKKSKKAADTYSIDTSKTSDEAIKQSETVNVGINAEGTEADGQSSEASDDAASNGENGLRLFFRVLLFSLGISAAFFILGLGVSAAAMFFNDNRMLLARAGGIIIILFGLYQLGFFGTSKVLGNEHRLPFQMESITSSPLTAFVMGFTFSFAWTPCVGPALTSVLIMAGSAETSFKGFLLIGVYTLGFILPFLLAGIFTARLLGFFRKHMSIVHYTAKAGGMLMILMGLLMFTGRMNDITGYLSRFQSPQISSEQVREDAEGGEGDNTENGESDDIGATASAEKENDRTSAAPEDIKAESASPENDTAGNDTSEDETAVDDEASADPDRIAAYDFELTDQFGNTHKLSDYKGKVIFLNFWATWCPPCKAEMPDIQELYERYESQGDEAEVAIIGVAAPNMGSEGSAGEIADFLEENGYTYPVLMDSTWEMFMWYGISAFPTTFMIDADGYIYGYVPGQMSMDIMESIIDQTLENDK